SAAARWASAHLAFGDRRKRRKKQAMLRTAEDITRTLGEMKGAVMKVGQVLSMMSGVLPDEMASQLAALQSNAPPMSYEVVRKVFHDAYGRESTEVVRRVQKQPFAAASIGQVHRVELDDGTQLAVKVQYPGVREAIDHDLANVGMMIKLGG